VRLEGLGKLKKSTSSGLEPAQVADAHARVQRLVSVVKMAKVFEQSSVVRFCAQKDSLQRIFIKKCFLFMVGSGFCIKRFTTGSRKVAIVSLMTKRLKRRCGNG
jgi:hypothetical protein